ncbi:IclR family transcriptional regulator [Arthrobacter sp. MI7-26]|uniref:IclR family transcriptional regulator n=1 Tax=Arthrobacter sp. MI7-26 TaxID=2993653 RepID=UPI0022489362|nr:IclR family transcriptional regulator [Arthrobacter sp. MI7-26]MCX2748218.1 IclR family transcriptional regulator [Arthrobacter sp. MI7-26]
MSQTVGRAIDILEYCSDQPREIKDIADSLGVHRTTAMRLVNTLIGAGFLRKDDSGRFGVGFRLAGLAQSALEQFDLRSLVHPHILQLSKRVGHTVQFAVPEAAHLVYVDKIEPPDSITLNTKIGGSVVVHTAGVSKAILAFLQARQRDQILDHASFEQFTATTITSREEFLRVLEDVRKNGWAADRGEYESFSNCIAAPVHSHTGAVAGAISITAFKERADLDALKLLLPQLLETTHAISQELGWREPGAPAEG